MYILYIIIILNCSLNKLLIYCISYNSYNTLVINGVYINDVHIMIDLCTFLVVEIK